MMACILAIAGFVTLGQGKYAAISTLILAVDAFIGLY